MAPTSDEINRARRRRLLIIVAITAAVEGILAIVAHIAPAMATLFRPVYWIVAAIGAITMWQSYRRHPRHERRRADRRSGPRN